MSDALIPVPATMPIEERRRFLETLADEDAVSPMMLARAAILPRDPRAALALGLAQAQALGFHADPVGEWFQRAPLTERAGGDCDDHVEWFLALMRAWARRNNSSLRVRAFYLRLPQFPEDHWTALYQLAPGEEWRWAEPSERTAALGENPLLAAARVRGVHLLAPGVAL